MFEAKFKNGHVTLTTTFLELFVILKLGYDIVDMCTKFDDSSFSRSRRDVIGGRKI